MYVLVHAKNNTNFSIIKTERINVLPKVSSESLSTEGFVLCESTAEVHESGHERELWMRLHDVELATAADGIAEGMLDGCEVVSQSAVEPNEREYIFSVLKFVTRYSIMKIK